jgi:hypothetical protein
VKKGAVFVPKITAKHIEIHHVEEEWNAMAKVQIHTWQYYSSLL